MIKHIVFFKLKDKAENADKVENAKKIKNMLDKLPAIIDEIIEYEVGINFVDSERAWDLSLISTFANVQELDKYRVHPEHLNVVEFIKAVSEKTAVVDYEI
jgi:hypothetical protein